MEQLLFSGPHDLALTLLALLIGLLIGSFLNVVIHRTPQMIIREFENSCAEHAGGEPIHTEKYNLAVPRSACPHCKHRIGALENIPVASYLVLRGKCKGCKAPISPRYPIIEAVCGLASAALVWFYGGGYLGLASLFFFYSLLAMTMIDFDTQLLPDSLTLPLFAVGLLVNVEGLFAPFHQSMFVPLPEAVIGAVAGFMILWTVNFVYAQWRGHDGMGEGDFKLLAALGAWMGWKMLLTIILLSSLVGSVVGLSLMLFRKHGRDVPIPFGPYLAGAGMIAFLYGRPITAWYQNLLQL